jgi:uncharacterized protein YaiI (UPF0178 family)
MIALFIDADACPVKQEIYRVAERHALKGTALKVFVVTNSPIAVPRDPMIERVVVGSGMDEADNWIAERAGEITGGPKPFSPRDRSSFLAALDQAIVRLRRAGFGQKPG